MRNSNLKISLAIALAAIAGISWSEVDASVSNWNFYETLMEEFDPDINFVRHDFDVVRGKQFVSVNEVDITTSDDVLMLKTIKKTIPTHISDQYLARVVLAETQDGSAYAAPIEGNERKWEIVIDVEAHEGDRKDLKQTAIHEVAHVMTLNQGQVEADYGTCNTLELEEGCLKPDSYLYLFYQKFWKGQFKQDASNSQYEKAPSAFVSDYAATNLAEDFAETFAVFVMNSKSLGTSLADQKVRSLYEYPELVKIRVQYQAG